MTFKEAELEISELKWYNREDYNDKEIEALTMAEETLCIFSDIQKIINRFQEEDSNV